MIFIFELLIKLGAFLFPILLGALAYENSYIIRRISPSWYFYEDYIFAIFGFFGGVIISAIVFGFLLTIIEIYNTLKKILDLLDSKIGNEKNQEIKRDSTTIEELTERKFI